ncbi:MAG: ribonucleoside-diphosphate reductase subunit alpha [Candidatus Gracilibacteria bacterium]|nr:ribonucleoside-diphosphate reductase subunit alpha [Candidatus Gracilibacteria bacterium]
MTIKFIKTRAGDLVPFDRTRIESVIEKAASSVGRIDLSFVEDVTDKILERLETKLIKKNEKELIQIEEIQDEVEIVLMKEEYFDIMKHFIIYRSEKQKEREKQREKVEKKLEKKTLKILKSTGEKQDFDMLKVKETYKRVSYKLARKCSFEVLEDSLKKYIVEGMKTSDITKMMIKSAIDLISVENISWQFIAGRLALIDLYKEASKNREMDIKKIYEAKHYLTLFKDYVKKGLYSKDFFDYYSEEDILEAGNYLKKDYDYDYNYTTMMMYRKRYLLNPNKVVFELPQEMYMSVALFLAMPEPKEKRLDFAKKVYDACATGKVSLPTPTLLNARTNFHQLSSCFKFNLDDDLRAIYHNIENMAQVSKFGGGIGVYLGNIRSKGGTIRGVKGTAGGVNPWIKVINDTAVAVNQLGARAGAISVTLDVFHRDIYDFLELQTETGDIRSKAFDIFPSVTFPDLFMERVANNEDWTLFDPKEITDLTGKKLQNHFCEEFETFYKECENNDKLLLKKTVNAKDLFKTYMKVAVETGMPYAFFRDTVNRLNPNKHAGNVYSTQLCVEICQNTSPSKFIEEEIEDGKIVIKYEPGDNVVCNLASINIAKVNEEKDIQEMMPIVARILDNVITLNFYPIKEVELTAKKYRSIGIGFLGLAEYLAVNKLSYDTQEARDETNRLFELYSYHTLSSSNKLAKERGTYEVYKGSEWSKGILLGKDENWFKNNSKMSEKWSRLIADIKKDGMRFAYHLAPAPNTSTSLVVGTTASILPIYKKYFVETNAIAPSVNVAPNLTQENFWYYKEYTNLDMKDVIDMVAVIYKWIDQSISFEWMIDPAKTSPRELYEYYVRAYKAGIKTVYYMRSMSLEVKESCDSCSG